MFKQLVKSQRGFTKTVYVIAGCVGALLLAPYLGLLHWSAELSSSGDESGLASKRRSIVREPIDATETDESFELESTARSTKKRLQPSLEEADSLAHDPSIEDIEELLGRE